MRLQRATIGAATGRSIQPVPWAAAAPSPQIETVIVTATKVRTNLQKTPVAITMIGGAACDRENIAAPRDLDNIVPGLVVNTTPPNPLAISIRGAGYEGTETTSAQPGVSFDRNGVSIASPIVPNANFLDADTGEILRGPQGTVLGQNSDGGATNVTSIRPRLDVSEGYTDSVIPAALNPDSAYGDQAALQTGGKTSSQKSSPVDRLRGARMPIVPRQR